MKKKPTLQDLFNKMDELQSQLFTSYNLLQKDLDTMIQSIDPYAKQRQWIGKKCKFWDNNHEKPSFDILAAIHDNHECPFITKHGYIYHNCEIIKETKGE